MRALLSTLLFAATAAPAFTQSILFDFDSAPLHAPFPVDLTVAGITAHLSATGQGYSIQDTSAPVVPVGFTGHFLYPSSVYAADLLISFSVPIADFSILYAPQELACDDSARMRVTAYTGTTLVGTVTTTAPNPGTWPASTLRCAFAAGFDNVVVHYDAPPPTCTDYGVIFLADDMRITPTVAASYTHLGNGCAGSLPASRLAPQGLPQLGTTFQVTLNNLPTNVAFLFTGFSAAMSAFGPLPLAAGVLGMPGCTAYNSDEFVQFVTGSNHTFNYLLPIPNDVALVGLAFYHQALVIDPQAGNALGAVLSESCAGVVGQ